MSADAAARSPVVALFEGIGKRSLSIFEEVGRFFYILHTTIYWTFRRPFDAREWVRQMVRVGVDSIPVVGLTAMFTGMVMALQTYRGFERFHAEGFVASVVSLSLTRELAPVLAALMIAGRIGSSLAAELGTMRVTEQIDALYAMATEPIHYLVVPRVGATTLMLPLSWRSRTDSGSSGATPSRSPCWAPTRSCTGKRPSSTSTSTTSSPD